MINIINNLSSMGKAFRAERKAVGMTQSQVAEKSGLRRETIIQIESGKNVSLHTLLQAISALGKTLTITDIRIDYDRLRDVFDEL